MKIKLLGLLSLLLLASPVAFANDVYITQSGASLDLDITQDVQNNKVGNSTTDANLSGASMTFSVTQTGSTNVLQADVVGDSVTVDVDVTGSTNDIVLNCDASEAKSCDNVDIDVDITDANAGSGDGNDVDIDIATTASSDDSDVTLSLTGDTNTANIDIDGDSAPVSITSTGSLNTFNVDVDGDGDVAGHSVTLNHTGSSGVFDVTVSGVYDSNVDVTTSGASADVDITITD